MWLFACLCLVFSSLGGVNCTCPSQCSCEYHGRYDSSGSRSVLCNDLDMNEVPTNFPVDTVKLRIEKAEVRRVPAEAFYYLVELQYLWLAYSSVAILDTRSFYNLKQLHELRLDGNSLTAFPWVSLLDMPHLKTLDLHNNRITSVPHEAVRYLRNLTCLDLSSNRLTTLPPDFLDSWSHVAVTPSRSPDIPLRRIVLGLQDNPWFCDCHISKVIELSKVADHTVVLLDPLMVCSEPESFQGILFQRVELEKCLKPSVMMSATKITSALGSNVLLRCDAKGYPTPQLIWTRSDSSPVNYTVIQESPGEGVRWSILSLTGISYKDSGDYRCKAKNLAGTSEAVVTVTVVGVVTTTLSPDTSERSPGEHPEQQHPQPGLERSTPPSKSWLSPELSSPSPYPSPSAALTTSTSPPPPSSSPPIFSAAFATTSVKTSISGSTIRTSHQIPLLHRGGKSNAKIEKNGRKFPPLSASKKEELALLDQAAPTETNVTIRDLRVARETGGSVTLTWNSSSSSSSSSSSTQESAVTVLYSKYGEKDLLLVNADYGKNQATINGLEPGSQYVACVCPKGVGPREDLCITFSTNRVEGRDSQWSLLIVVTSTACVIVVPLICFLLYKVCKLQCTSDPFWEDDLSKETYIQFETLSPRSLSLGELWTRRHKDDGEKLLLCSRSSVDSQMNLKSDGCRPEYYG
ncbi:leucine-rich repeat, immunoglobulin-like domain and transmembrane domain-containing protein 3 [Apodemus sylvaticus]|uniref:leucine-rich repeat, immunoglobulin-like domain and transmembrane domain-containing protein 3 n=1 Tax=Apodemus sylvaticus TaxID=10129 RepID=UPI002243E903|nr:leucine-rich repeat, immunoglobulin-like domain and transmembrane domain-containing protein 3 [Apodemus sylvaticus]